MRRHRGVTPYDGMCDTEAMHTWITPWKTKEGAAYHAGAPGDDGGEFADSEKSSRRSAMPASAALPAVNPAASTRKQRFAGARLH